MAPINNGPTPPPDNDNVDEITSLNGDTVDVPPSDNDDNYLYTSNEKNGDNDDIYQESETYNVSNKSITTSSSSLSHKPSPGVSTSPTPLAAKKSTSSKKSTTPVADDVSSRRAPAGWEGWDREEMRQSLGQSYQRHTNVLHDEDQCQLDDTCLFGDESGEKVRSGGTSVRRKGTDVPLAQLDNIAEQEVRGRGGDKNDGCNEENGDSSPLNEDLSNTNGSQSASDTCSDSSGDDEGPFETVHDQGICPSLKEQDAQVELAKERQQLVHFPRSMRRKSIGTLNREKFMNAVKKNDACETYNQTKSYSSLFSQSTVRLTMRQKRVWCLTFVAAVMVISVAFVSVLDGWIQDPLATGNNFGSKLSSSSPHDNHMHYNKTRQMHRDSRQPSATLQNKIGGKKDLQAHQGKNNNGGRTESHKLNQHARNIITNTPGKILSSGLHDSKKNILSYATTTEASLSSFADVWENIHEGDVPVFWHVPKSGGTTLELVLIQCLGLVGATSVESGVEDKAKLQVITYNNSQYINADSTTPQGIQQEHTSQLIESSLVDIIFTSQFHKISTLFSNTQQRGRLFCLFRHPVKRAISIFYHIKRATWEPTYNPSLAQMTLLEYIESEYSMPMYDNILVRTLTNNIDQPLTEQDVDNAKDIVRRKIVVGVMEHFDASMIRFEQYFGWSFHDESNKGMNGCELRTIAEGDKRYSHDNYKPDTKEFQLLAIRNWADVELYHYANFLFVEQSSLV